MTDEERQKLCEDLRRCKSSWLEDAANEIERLAKEKENLRSAAYNYAKEVEQKLDELKDILAESAWWLR